MQAIPIPDRAIGPDAARAAELEVRRARGAALGYAAGRPVTIARCDSCARDVRGPRLGCADPGHRGPG